MGKGDIRTRRGKIWRGTYGVTRPRRWKTATPRPAAKARKVKTLKDLPKAVGVEQLKKVIVESVKPQVVETKAAVIEAQQSLVENVVAATTPVVEVPVHTETKEVGIIEKTPAKKASKPAAKKTPAAKKPAAKKAPVKKKK